MKVEGFIFSGLAAFLLVASVPYWWLSRYIDGSSNGAAGNAKGDWTGTTCLVLSGGLAALIGYFLWFTARRMDARPEDRSDADISDGAGEVGFFSPYSWWPIGVAGAFSIVGLGVIFGFFIGLIGLVLLTVTAVGFLFEYYVDRPFGH